jgi:DNA repair photolyase
MDKVHYLQNSDGISMLFAPHPLFRADASLTPYAGCPSRCLLCPYGSAGSIGIKTDFLHQLEQRLKGEMRQMQIALGAACEPYCRQEETFNTTRNSLELLIAHELPVQILTKSELVLRDIGLCREHSRKGLLAVSVSLFTADDRLSSLFEPDAALPGDRLAIVRELKKNGVFAGIVLAPILPYVSDGADQLDEVFRKAKKAGAEYVIPSVASIETPQVRQRLIAVYADKFPKILHRMGSLYERECLPSVTYTRRIGDILADLGAKYGIPLYLPTENDAAEFAGVRHRLLK